MKDGQRVCVCERERESEREKIERERESLRLSAPPSPRAEPSIRAEAAASVGFASLRGAGRTAFVRGAMDLPPQLLCGLSAGPCVGLGRSGRD